MGKCYFGIYSLEIKIQGRINLYYLRLFMEFNSTGQKEEESWEEPRYNFQKTKKILNLLVIEEVFIEINFI
jgi:hypothetical protein